MRVIVVEDRFMLRLSVLLLMLFSVTAQAQTPTVEEQEVGEAATEEVQVQRIYRTVDEQGRTVFTDAPDPRGPAQEVEVRPQNTIPMVLPTVTPPAEEKADDEFSGYELAITSPANQETLNNPESMTISVSVNPPPGKGHVLRILDNGEEVTKVVEWPDRGEHRLLAQVVGEDGRVLAESAPVVVYVQRVSILNK